MDVAPDAKTGIVTEGVTVTVCKEACGPLHPEAVAVIMVVPLQLTE
jgi:hypothetical protein